MLITLNPRYKIQVPNLRGNSEWFTDEYFDCIDAHKDAINVHPMYFYSENFSAIDYCRKHKMNLIFK